MSVEDVIDLIDDLRVSLLKLENSDGAYDFEEIYIILDEVEIGVENLEDTS